MKISEFSTEKATDILCQVIPYIESMLKDDTLRNELTKGIDFSDADTIMGRYTIAIEKFSILIPILLKEHRKDVFGILAIMNEKTVAEIGKQNIMITMKEIKELVKDEEFVAFFKSCTNAEGGE